MKIIQSYWSKPSINEKSGRSKGGWLHNRFHYMSWALSCLQLKRFYPDIELYTDAKGAELLINILQLPYSYVHIVLDELNDFHEDLWALGKIHTYSLQDQPFLHVDGDVFIWEKFPSEFEASDLIVQTEAINYHYYNDFLISIENTFKYIPEPIKKLQQFGNEIYFPNAGIIGGTNIVFFKNYASEVYTILNANKDALQKINKNLFNNFFEEYLFLALVKYQGLKLTSYIKDVDEDFFSLVNFEEIGNGINYLHVIGTHKQYLANCKRLEIRLAMDHPEYYSKNKALFDQAWF